LGWAAAPDIPAETRWNLDRGIDFAALHAVLQLGRILQRRLLDEVSGSPEFADIRTAFEAVVSVKHCKRKRVDVGSDAESDDEHQKSRTEEREAQPYGIAQKLEGFPDRVSEHAARRKNARHSRGFPNNG